jgi:hypothetical protein
MSVHKLFVKGGKAEKTESVSGAEMRGSFSIEVSTGVGSLSANMIFQFRATNARREMLPSLVICPTAKKTLPFSPQSIIRSLLFQHFLSLFHSLDRECRDGNNDLKPFNHQTAGIGEMLLIFRVPAVPDSVSSAETLP